MKKCIVEKKDERHVGGGERWISAQLKIQIWMYRLISKGGGGGDAQ